MEEKRGAERQGTVRQELGRQDSARPGMVRMTEAEARAMLAADNAREKEKAKRASARKKRMLVVVTIFAVVLVVAGVAVSAVIGGMRGEKDGGSGRNEGNSGSSEDGEGGSGTAGSESDDKSSGKGSGSGTVPSGGLTRLSTNDESVRKLYDRFDVMKGLFYEDEEVLPGEVADLTKLAIARMNTETTACKGMETNREVYGENFSIWEKSPDGRARTECYSGAEVLVTMWEMFGNDMSLEDGMRIGSFTAGGQPFYKYDAELDEFWNYDVPGGGVKASVGHELYAAEKDSDRIYLYDVAAWYMNCFDGETKWVASEVGDSQVYGNGCNEELVVDYVDPETLEMDAERLLADKDKYSRFKWTFKKTEDGNYVFEGIEKV